MLGVGLDLLDEEVFAVVLALVTVGSVAGAALLLRPAMVEPFLAIGLLNAECVIGDYPDTVFNGQNVSLCIFLDNHEGVPVYLQVRYKVVPPGMLPTNSTPSPAPTVEVFEAVLGRGENTTMRVGVPVNVSRDLVGGRVALVFELWRYVGGGWVYTGRWVHLYVRVLPAP